MFWTIFAVTPRLVVLSLMYVSRADSVLTGVPSGSVVPEPRLMVVGAPSPAWIVRELDRISLFGSGIPVRTPLEVVAALVEVASKPAEPA